MTTIALIERKPTITRDLFSRYWRDVHGVMAARIPGFDSYTQYHVTPLDTATAPFEGIAIVTYASQSDRAGLLNSEITQHIHRDEQNVFRRALLYNLDEGADVTVIPETDDNGVTIFAALTSADDVEGITARFAMHATLLVSYDLTGGDPSAWNATDAEGSRFVRLLHGRWPTLEAASDAARDVAAYRLDEAHVMVVDGRPTAVGLRGLDAVRTIAEAGADNQLDAAVVKAIYGLVQQR